MKSSFRGAVATVAIAALGLLAGACGSSGDDNDDGSAATGKSKKDFKVGLVTDIGGLNDRGFNHLAFVGSKRAEKELGVQVRVLTSKSNADYVPNLTTLAQQQYDLIIPVGFNMIAATESAAKQLPDAKFAIVDVDATSLKSKPRNIQGLIFKEEQGGYLAGYVAGLYAKANDVSTISSVGGQKFPTVDRYIAGYQAGAKAANPGIKTLNGYSQDFAAQDKCKEVALDQIAQGSEVVFQVAGGCGLGALDAAKEKGVQGIGVDADQAYLGPYILTSALKRVDVAVFNAIKDAMDGRFPGGKNSEATLANGGIGLGKISPAGAQFADQLKKIEAEIKSGKIADIPTTVD